LERIVNNSAVSALLKHNGRQMMQKTSKPSLLSNLHLTHWALLLATHANLHVLSCNNIESLKMCFAWQWNATKIWLQKL